MARQFAAVLDGAADLFGAVHLEREPGLERPEAARQVGPEIAGPGRAGLQAAALAPQVGGGGGEGVEVRLAVAHDQEAGVVGHLAPLVEVEGDRVGLREAGQQRTQRGREHAQRAERAVDVEPESFAIGDPGQRGEVVDRADVHGSGGSGDEERGQAGRAILRDRGLERGQVDLEALVHRHQPQRGLAEAGQVHRLRDAVVRARRRVGDEARLRRGQAVAAHVRAERPGARDQHGHQVGHRRAGDEQAAGRRREREQLAHPVQHLLLDLERDLVAPTEVGVQAGGQHLGQRAHRRAAALHPAHEAGVRVAGGVGQDVAHEGVVHGREIGRRLRQRGAELVAHVLRRRRPDRALPGVAGEIEDVVEHAMRLGAERGPVGRVQRGAGVVEVESSHPHIVRAWLRHDPCNKAVFAAKFVAGRRILSLRSACYRKRGIAPGRACRRSAVRDGKLPA